VQLQVFQLAALAFLLCVGLTPALECYRSSEGRGAGVPISKCAAGLEQNGLLCYPPCNSGYSGVGPVCWQQCPPGYTDTGAFCSPSVWSGDNGGCPWYDKCGLTFAQGCVKCPAGSETHGCLCSTPGSTFAKNSYGRGAGVPLVCADNLELSGALCYPYCPAGMSGEGPVCWGNCPSGTITCGAMCVPNSGDCVGKIFTVGAAATMLTIQIALCVASGGTGCNLGDLKAKLADLYNSLNLPPCQG